MARQQKRPKNCAHIRYPAFAAHQAGGADELNGVAERGLLSDTCQHCVSFLTQIHILFLTPDLKI